MTYSRILLKLSGEVFGSDTQVVDHAAITQIAERIAGIAKGGTQIAIVVGAGNIWRARDNADSGIDRATSDEIGMLATAINGSVLQSALLAAGCRAQVFSALPAARLAEPFEVERARAALDGGSVVICVGGTGNPYFTTDTAAALRALELRCEIVLKATNVDGVYDKDPRKHPDATKYDELSFVEAIEKHLRVMDQTAFSLCMEANLPIRVFNVAVSGALEDAAAGKSVGTLVR